MKKNDKGARGFGFGEIDAETEKFLTPDFDRKKQTGPDYVGKYNKVTDAPGRSDD
jgi:hypothetical protein